MGVTGHCLLLQLLFHAAANAKTTSHLTPAEAFRHSSLGVPSSIPFFFTREEPRQEASLLVPESPAAPPRQPSLRAQAATAAAATRHYHREHLGWPVEDLNNASPWGGVSYRGRHPASHYSSENQQEYVGNVSSAINRTESTGPLRARPSEWRKLTQSSVHIEEGVRTGALPETTGGSRHENLKRGLRRRYSPGDKRGKIKANLVSGEAAWEVSSMQTDSLFPRWLPQSPSLSNKKKMESEHFCVDSHLEALPSLSLNTVGGGARPQGEASGPQATQTPDSDIELMSFEESAEDLRRLEEENSGGEEWTEEDELPLTASPDYFKNPRGVLRRWKRKSKYPLRSL